MKRRDYEATRLVHPHDIGRARGDYSAWRRPSSEAAPAEHRGRGPKGWKRSDARIREEVCEILFDHPEIDASEIEVGVENGEVTLSGSVDDRNTKRLVEDVIEEAPGIVDVHNELRVAKQQEAQSQDRAA